MERRFWLERWSKNQIGFHQEQFNPTLVRHWPGLDLPAACPVFVPLCGKTRDMRWLSMQGHKVLGIELSELAVDAYFDESGEPVSVTEEQGLSCHRGQTAEIYQGDFFDLTAAHLKGVRACFDRGSLVALPVDMRRRYADHLLRVLDDDVQILLLTVEYDQALVAGPPHSVSEDEVRELYGKRCTVNVLESSSSDQVPPHFRSQGVERITNTAYHLRKNE